MMTRAWHQHRCPECLHLTDCWTAACDGAAHEFLACAPPCPEARERSRPLPPLRPPAAAALDVETAPARSPREEREPAVWSA